MHDRALLWNFRPLAALIELAGVSLIIAARARAASRPTRRRLFRRDGPSRLGQLAARNQRVRSLFTGNLNTIKRESGSRMLHLGVRHDLIVFVD